MDLTIKGDAWQMVIHLEEFMGARNVSKFRKFVKEIRGSNTPEELEHIHEFIEQEIEQFEPRQNENARFIVGYTEKVHFCEEQIQKFTSARQAFKKDGKCYKEFTEGIKTYRAELSVLKAELRKYKRAFENCIRNKGFYEKCLKIISQGR